MSEVKCCSCRGSPGSAAAGEWKCAVCQTSVTQRRRPHPEHGPASICNACSANNSRAGSAQPWQCALCSASSTRKKRHHPVHGPSSLCNACGKRVRSGDGAAGWRCAVCGADSARGVCSHPVHGSDSVCPGCACVDSDESRGDQQGAVPGGNARGGKGRSCEPVLREAGEPPAVIQSQAGRLVPAEEQTPVGEQPQAAAQPAPTPDASEQRSPAAEEQPSTPPQSKGQSPSRAAEPPLSGAQKASGGPCMTRTFSPRMLAAFGLDVEDVHAIELSAGAPTAEAQANVGRCALYDTVSVRQGGCLPMRTAPQRA